MTRSITNKKTRSEYSSREHLYLATSALGILPPAPGISKAPTSASKNNQGCGSPFNFSGSGPSCFLKYGFGSRSSCFLIRIRIQPKITFITNFFAFLLLLFFNFFFPSWIRIHSSANNLPNLAQLSSHVQHLLP